MEKREITLDQLRGEAVGKHLSKEELERFHAGWEEERQIPTRHGETHVYLYGPGKKGEGAYPLLLLFRRLSTSWNSFRRCCFSWRRK